MSARLGGDVVVTINGVDVYDPKTGAIRSNAIDLIAYWFIDTDYNDERFFVRHAHFWSARKPTASSSGHSARRLTKTPGQAPTPLKAAPSRPPNRARSQSTL